MTDLLTDSAKACSLRLAKYMRDKTTIRSYVMANFGRAPSLQAIQSMIDEHRRIKRGDRRHEWYSSPQPSDALHWQPGSLIGTRTPAVFKKPPEPRPIEPHERLARMIPRARVAEVAMPIVPAQRVLVRASELFAVPVEVITGKSRTRPHTAPRFCVAYALRIFSEGKLSYPQIGQLLGGRDHSSVINAFQVFEKLLLDGDEGLADIIAELRVAWDAQVKVDLPEAIAA